MTPSMVPSPRIVARRQARLQTRLRPCGVAFWALRWVPVGFSALGPCFLPSSPALPALGLSKGQADPIGVAIGSDGAGGAAFFVEAEHRGRRGLIPTINVAHFSVRPL